MTPGRTLIRGSTLGVLLGAGAIVLISRATIDPEGLAPSRPAEALSLKLATSIETPRVRAVSSPGAPEPLRLLLAAHLDAMIPAAHAAEGPAEPAKDMPTPAPAAPRGRLSIEALAQPRDIGEAGDLFGTRSWFVPPPPPPPPPPAPPPVPTAPPLPFRLLGAVVEPDGRTIWFLGRGTGMVEAYAGQDIDAEYRLERADNGQLHFLYKPLKTPQSLPIGEMP